MQTSVRARARARSNSTEKRILADEVCEEIVTLSPLVGSRADLPGEFSPGETAVAVRCHPPALDLNHKPCVAHTRTSSGSPNSSRPACPPPQRNAVTACDKQAVHTLCDAERLAAETDGKVKATILAGLMEVFTAVKRIEMDQMGVAALESCPHTSVHKSASPGSFTKIQPDRRPEIQPDPRHDTQQDGGATATDDDRCIAVTTEYQDRVALYIRQRKKALAAGIASDEIVQVALLQMRNMCGTKQILNVPYTLPKAEVNPFKSVELICAFALHRDRASKQGYEPARIIKTRNTEGVLREVMASSDGISLRRLGPLRFCGLAKRKELETPAEVILRRKALEVYGNLVDSSDTPLAYMRMHSRIRCTITEETDGHRLRAAKTSAVRHVLTVVDTAVVEAAANDGGNKSASKIVLSTYSPSLATVWRVAISSVARSFHS